MQYCSGLFCMFLLPLLNCDDRELRQHQQATYSSVTYWHDREKIAVLELPVPAEVDHRHCDTTACSKHWMSARLYLPYNAFAFSNDLHACTVTTLQNLCRSICRGSSKESKKGCWSKQRLRKQQKRQGPSGMPLPPSAMSLEGPLLLAMPPQNLKMTFPPPHPLEAAAA